MTAESDDDIMDSLFHGCALAAYVDQAIQQQGRPDSLATRQRAYAYYEAALYEKNRRKSAASLDLPGPPDKIVSYETITKGDTHDRQADPHLYQPGRRLRPFQPRAIQRPAPAVPDHHAAAQGSLRLLLRRAVRQPRRPAGSDRRNRPESGPLRQPDARRDAFDAGA